MKFETVKNVVLLFMVLLIANIGFAQQYKSHKVGKGENIYRIAKRYNTTAEAIYKMNPTAKTGIKEGEILAIPITNNEEYNTHVVDKGDTVYSISKKYNTTTEALYILNPEAINGINIGQVLRVSKSENVQTTTDGVVQKEDVGNSILDSIEPLKEIKKVIRFKTHKVKRKETLYGIAQEYGITVDDIKKNNRQLYSEDIRKKDKIRIPVYEEKVVDKKNPINLSIKERLSNTTKYIVKPKDTEFGIARRHGITVGELEALNPRLDPTFRIGTEITVPATVFIPYDKELVKPGFELYTVPPKETMFNLVRTLNISSDSLLQMNPYIREGLKEGMVITVPKRSSVDTLGINFAEGVAINLENKLFNFKPKKIAVMLPFNLESFDLNEREQTEEYLKSRKAQGTKVALDFYKGLLIAIDSAKTKGITTEVDIFDTQKTNNADYLKKMIGKNNFNKIDVVVGPLYQSNVEAVASVLKTKNIPVVSPISNRESKLYENFFQTIPSDAMLQDKLVTFIKKDSLNKKNLILIIQTGAGYEAVGKKLKLNFPEAKIAKIEKGNYLFENNLNKVLSKDKANWVILESDDVAMISNVAALLNAKAESRKITLFTTDKNKSYDDDSVKNEHLSKLSLHYPSIDKEYDNYSNKQVTSFVSRYQKEYGTIPNKYAVRGFDITYDLLMRLGTADNLYHAASVEGTTEYVENKFNYAKKPLGGYYNKALYMIKFDNGLKLKVVE